LKAETVDRYECEFKRIGRSAVVLVVFGIAAFWGGTKTLVVLIPAALLIWFDGILMRRGGRNWPTERE